MAGNVGRAEGTDEAESRVKTVEERQAAAEAKDLNNMSIWTPRVQGGTIQVAGVRGRGRGGALSRRQLEDLLRNPQIEEMALQDQHRRRVHEERQQQQWKQQEEAERDTKVKGEAEVKVKKEGEANSKV
ncbi:hypothetical protein HDV57DRAFT_520458 [Trichoderma longibrachiatum]